MAAGRDLLSNEQTTRVPLAPDQASPRFDGTRAMRAQALYLREQPQAAARVVMLHSPEIQRASQ